MQSELEEIFNNLPEKCEKSVSVCSVCNENMIFQYETNNYLCICGKIENISGEVMSISNEPDRNIRISRSGNIYIESLKISIDEKVIKKISEINEKLNNKIEDKYINEIYKIIIDNHHDLIRRGDIKSAIYANCIKEIAMKYKIVISDKEIQAACDINNKKICDGKKRLRIANLSGFSTAGDNLLDDSSRNIDIMLEALAINKSHRPLILHYLHLYSHYSADARETKSRAAGAIWTYIKRKKLPISEEKMKTAVGISISTFTNIYKLTEDIIKKLYVIKAKSLATEDEIE